MPGTKHLILDVNVIVDLWLGLGSEVVTEQLVDLARDGKVSLWVSASSIPTLEYVARRSYKQRGVLPEEAGRLVARLMADLFETVNVLTNYGFEQKDVYFGARDVEDAQIAAAARSLSGASVCLVSEDTDFDALGEIPVHTPSEALKWLCAGDAASDTIPFIDLAAQQHLTLPSIEQGITGVLRHGQYIMGPEVAELEEKLAACTGARHCITVSSGTEALLISLMALGVGPGDEVITSPFTFISTGEVIALLGATPVFADIEPDTCNLDATKIEAKITPRTRAIIPVSLYGQPADFDAINAIVAQHNRRLSDPRSTIHNPQSTIHNPRSTIHNPQSTIHVIEDAAQSFGATYKGRQSGNLSTMGCTSFFPSKPLGCYGDGGAIFTSDEELARACREIRVHGQSKRYVHTRLGVGGRMDTLQCAIVLAKLQQFEGEIDRRLKIGAAYNRLMDEQGIERVCQRGDRTSVFAQYTVFVEGRDEVQARLKAAGIPTAVHYPVPLHRQPVFAPLGLPEGTYPVAEAAARRVMSLPMHPYLTEEGLSVIVSALKDSVR